MFSCDFVLLQVRVSRWCAFHHSSSCSLILAASLDLRGACICPLPLTHAACHHPSERLLFTWFLFVLGHVSLTHGQLVYPAACDRVCSVIITPFQHKHTLTIRAPVIARGRTRLHHTRAVRQRWKMRRRRCAASLVGGARACLAAIMIHAIPASIITPPRHSHPSAPPPGLHF